ncbi:MAG: D-glycerate dehydrogenase [Vampirovibrio sp.]|nr:D-glycerate dehydrogenase [Vampirovibrio sp.]
MPSQLPQILQFSAFPVSEFSRQQLVDKVQVQSLSREAFLEGNDDFSETVGLFVLLTDKVDVAVLDRLPNLRVITNYGAGFNNIDVEEATRRGIQVTNTPGILSEATADLTWGLMIAAARHIVPSDKLVRAGGFTGWQPELQLGKDLCGQTLGIVGLGDIGEKVARRAKGFEMRVVYYNRTRKSPEIERQLGAEYVSFDKLVAESDVISIHTPLTPETRHLFDTSTLNRMKPGSILINTSRGPVVDEAALVDVLQSGHLYAAGLDVFEEEPKVHPGLLDLDNVVMAAHIGSATYNTRTRMGDLAIENLLMALAGKMLPNPVNMVATQTIS